MPTDTTIIETAKDAANFCALRGDPAHAAAIRQVLDALAAPPAAGAPPALVADLRRELAALPPRNDRDYEAGFDRGAEWMIGRVLAWSPAPAPVAPPAETRACHGCGYSLVRCYDCKRGGAVACCPDCDHSERSTEPAPPAVAGGDAPEIQVGDWVRWRWFPNDPRVVQDAHAVAMIIGDCDVSIIEVRGERHGQPFIWRR